MRYCSYCTQDACVRDHVLPVSRGSDGVVVPACVRCNARKGNYDLALFLNEGKYFLNHRKIRKNKILMNYVRWDKEIKEYIQVKIQAIAKKLPPWRQEIEDRKHATENLKRPRPKPKRAP